VVNIQNLKATSATANKPAIAALPTMSDAPATGASVALQVLLYAQQHAKKPAAAGLASKFGGQLDGRVNMYVLAIVSQKGGVGKSTLAVHLATEATVQGQRVLLLDLDPQGSAMEWASRRGDVPPDVSGANPASVGKEIERARSEGYDLVVVDTAPHADHAALQAARSADLVAIPCRPSTFDIAAISATLDLCKLANKQATVVINAAPIRSRVIVEAGRGDL